MKNPQNPLVMETNYIRDGITHTSSGMTLLDYFAGQALMSMLDAIQEIDINTTPQWAATLSYAFAEAMLKEREKRNEHKTY